MNILALDMSTKSTGWALRINDELKYGCLTNASTSIEKRICYMRDSIIELIKEYNIEKIVLEDVRPDNTPNSSVTQKLNWLQGCVRIAIYENFGKKVEIETILPNSWRSKIGIKTGAGIRRDSLKIKDIAYVKTTYGVDVNDDIADAIGILDSYGKEDKKTVTEDGFTFG